MESTPSPVPPSTPKSQKVQTIGILMLISGIVNLLVGLIGGVGFVVSIILICCAPVYLLPIVLGCFEIYYATKLLSSAPERLPYNQVQAIAILEICTLLIGNVVSMILGIVNLVFINDPEARPYFSA